MHNLKPIPGYENLYSASPDGRIYSHVSGRYIAGSNGGKGYRIVSLRRDGAVKVAYVHRIIAELFIRPGLPGETVNHRDGRKTHNAWENLEWCSVRENLRHARAAGLNQSRPEPRRGLSNPAAKLSDEQIAEARQRHANGERNIDLARHFGLTPGGMSNILQGKKRRSAGTPAGQKSDGSVGRQSDDTATVAVSR